MDPGDYGLQSEVAEVASRQTGNGKQWAADAAGLDGGGQLGSADVDWHSPSDKGLLKP